MNTLLEVRRRPIGFGYSQQNWLETVHHIVRVGTLEARLIVPRGESVGFWGGATTIAAGLVLAIGGAK